MPTYPSGTVAFLFTDIEGSTRRWEAHRDSMRSAVNRHFDILRQAIEDQEGVLFKTIGDAVQAAFHTVPGALTAAVTAQRALQAEDWGELGPLQVRMAVHVGAASPHNGDYLAPALNRLARLMATGYGGQILLTDTARALAAGLPGDHSLLSLGQHRLRDLLEAEPVYQVLGPGLRRDFPPLVSLDTQPNNLPAQPTPLIGREAELVAVREALLATRARLVTLTGPGGAGKTRLAMQAAADALDAFPDGVWFASLAAVTSADLVLDEIATVLNVREHAGETLLASLTEYLKGKKLLLVLDNLEQVIEAARDLNALLAAAPDVVMLATSREPLRLRVEREIPLGTLPLPQDSVRSVDEATRSPAVQLFVDRAQRVKPAFTLDEGNVAEIVAICRRLDGLPLAIELAAARIRVLTPNALLARLDRRLAVLTSGARDLPERQQTLRAAIAWSHDLLPADERDLFARLAVFSGGCTYEAIEAICAEPGGANIDPLNGTESLMQKSLLRQEEGPADEPRFSMLETIREFAREQLETLPNAGKVRAAHADFYLDLAESANWDDFAAQATLLERLEADHANLRQAIAFFESAEPDGLPRRTRLAAALAHFWWMRGHLREGRRVLDQAIESPGNLSDDDLAHALFGAAMLAEAQWDLDRARELHERALELRRTIGDSWGVARSLTGLAEIARNEGDLDRARALIQEAIDVWRAIGDAAGIAGTTLTLGGVSFQRGDYAHAQPILNDVLEQFSRLKDVAGEANAYQMLGVLSLATGELEKAANFLAESLSRWRRLENQQRIAMDLANLSEAHLHQGALDVADAFARQSVALYEGLGDPVGEGLARSLMGRIALDRGDRRLSRELLQMSLRLCWSAGDRGGAAEILDALAEAVAPDGDDAWTAALLHGSDMLRSETGLRRMPYYARRYAQVRDTVGADLQSMDMRVEEVIERVLSGFAAAPAARLG